MYREMGEDRSAESTATVVSKVGEKGKPVLEFEI
jgi:hypothetical protein